jgi:hypothetical protein
MGARGKSRAIQPRRRLAGQLEMSSSLALASIPLVNCPASCKQGRLAPLPSKEFAREFDHFCASPELEGQIKEFENGFSLAATRGVASGRA